MSFSALRAGFCVARWRSERGSVLRRLEGGTYLADRCRVRSAGGRGDEVDEDAEGSGDGLGELAVEGEGHVGPAALADLGGDEAAALRGLGEGAVAAGVVGFGEGGVVGVPGFEEAVAALFDPVVEVGSRDLVGDI